MQTEGWKRAAKRRLAPGLVRLGRRLPTARTRRLFCDVVVPAFLDEAVIPRGLVPCAQRAPAIAVLCDPYEYVHRNGYFCGVFFEEEVLAYLRGSLRPGDSFLDVGTNVGHVALPAAALVGASGRVIGFEPQVELVARVRALASEQRLEALELHPVGLGDEAGELELRTDPAHLGGATFRAPGMDGATFPAARRCPIVRGDTLLRDVALPGRVGLKIDAEGFELPVIRGLAETLRTRVDHALVEVSPEWLGADGVATMFALFADAGLHAHALTPEGRVGRGLGPAEVRAQTNVVFLRTEAPAAQA